MQVRSLCWEDPLEEGMATHSSILAWRIPWLEEPGRLQSLGSQRAGHNWSDLTCTHREEVIKPQQSFVSTVACAKFSGYRIKVTLGLALKELSLGQTLVREWTRRICRGPRRPSAGPARACLHTWTQRLQLSEWRRLLRKSWPWECWEKHRFYFQVDWQGLGPIRGQESWVGQAVSGSWAWSEGSHPLWRKEGAACPGKWAALPMGSRGGWPSWGGLRLPFSMAKPHSPDLRAGAHGHQVSRPSPQSTVLGNGHGYKRGGQGEASVGPRCQTCYWTLTELMN